MASTYNIRICSRKLSKQRLCTLIIGIGCFLCVAIPTEIVASSFDLDRRQKLTLACDERHAFESCAILPVQTPLIVNVLRSVRRPQVLPTIVEPIAISVVTEHTARYTKNLAMERTVPGDTCRSIDSSDVKSNSIRSTFCMPTMAQNDWGILNVDDSPLALSEWKFHRSKPQRFQNIKSAHGERGEHKLAVQNKRGD